MVVQRLACLCAWWKQCGRPLEEDSGDLEFAILRVPGGVRGAILLQPTQCSALHGRLPRDATHNGYGAGGAWRNVSRRRIPDVRLLSQGHLCGTFHREHPPEHSKGGLQGKEGIVEQANPQTEGGMSYLSTSCRDAGSARSGDHLLLSPAYAVLRAISTPWPV